MHKLRRTVVGGRSVHVVKAMLPICEQKIYVLELAEKRKWLERARYDVDDPQRPDQLALLFNAAFTRSGVNGTVRSRRPVAS